MIQEDTGTQDLLVRLEDKVAVITLNRPEALNALNIEMAERFSEKLNEWAKDENIKRFHEYPWSDNDYNYAYYIEPFNMVKTTKNFFLKIVKLETCL